MCITTNLPNSKPNTNLNPNPNPITKQHANVSIQMNVVACPTRHSYKAMFSYCTVYMYSISADTFLFPSSSPKWPIMCRVGR